METRSKWMMVSLVVGLLISAAIAFALWLRAAQNAEGPTYEIHFESSVDGLHRGSGVNFLGVPIGRVTEIRLQPANPGVVTVRFVVTQDMPLRRGVTASIARSFVDGSATISLEGGDEGAPALVARAGQPFPIVPARSGGLVSGDLDPADLIARVSSGAERLSNELDPAGQRNIEERLTDLATRSRAWKGELDRIAGQIAQPGTVAAAGRAMGRAGDDAERLRRRIEASRASIRETVAKPLQNARRTVESLGQSALEARPRIRQLEENAREVTDTVRSLRDPVQNVGDAVQKTELEGLGSTELPDYDPQVEDR